MRLGAFVPDAVSESVSDQAGFRRTQCSEKGNICELYKKPGYNNRKDQVCVASKMTVFKTCKKQKKERVWYNTSRKMQTGPFFGAIARKRPIEPRKDSHFLHPETDKFKKIRGR